VRMLLGDCDDGDDGGVVWTSAVSASIDSSTRVLHSFCYPSCIESFCSGTN